jgi:hypothetical protein
LPELIGKLAASASQMQQEARRGGIVLGVDKSPSGWLVKENAGIAG